MLNPKLPELPMTPEHQRLILAGTKTTTLRSQRLAPGLYIMRATNGTSYGVVQVLPVPAGGRALIKWDSLDHDEAEELAAAEGYPGDLKGFVAVLQRFYPRFLIGQSSLHLHHLQRPSVVTAEAITGDDCGSH